MIQQNFKGTDFRALPPRPNEKDQAILELAATRALKRLQQIYPNESFARDTVDLLIKTLKGYHADGYDRAKDWEREGWSPDATLVEFLSDLDAYRETRDAIKEWVAAHDIKCPFPLNAKVRIATGGKEITGEITAIHAEGANVTVFCESLGHVREGVGTRGLIIDYEDLAYPAETGVNP